MSISERLRQWRRDHHADLGALAVILIFFLLFFWRVFLRGDLPLIRDPMAYSHPLRSVAWEMIRSGSLPLWTPYIFSGYPLLSMAQLGLGYPVTWGYLFLPSHWAETVYVIAPFLFAPAFLYAYVRVLGRSRLAALIAGLSFTYGGMMASKLSNGMLPNAVMWLPLMLIAIERARTGRFLPSLVGATGAYAMSILTGIGQGFLLVGMIAGAYSLFVAAYDFRRLRWRVWKPVGVAVGSLVLAVRRRRVSDLRNLDGVAAERSQRTDLRYLRTTFAPALARLGVAVDPALLPHRVGAFSRADSAGAGDRRRDRGREAARASSSSLLLVGGDARRESAHPRHLYADLSLGLSPPDSQQVPRPFAPFF